MVMNDRRNASAGKAGGGPDSVLARRGLLAAAWLALCLLLSRQAVAAASLWLSLLATLALALPVLLAALYLHSVRLIHRATLYRAPGLLRRLATSRVPASLFWCGWSLALGAGCVFWFATLTPVEIILVVAAAPLFTAFAGAAARLTERQLAPFAARAAALHLTRLLLPALLTAASLLVALTEDAPAQAAPLGASFRALAEAPLDPAASHLVQGAARLAAYGDAAGRYLVQHAAASRPLHLAALLIGNYALFLHVALLLSAWLVPAAEYRRVFATLTPSPAPPPVTATTTVLVAALGTLLLLLLLPALAGLEQELRQRYRSAALAPAAERRLVRYAERIDGVLYEPGTLAAIDAARLALLENERAALNALSVQARRAFAQLRANVDPYLDHYYSLPAEYLRIAGAASGDLQHRIREDLEARLMAGDALSALADMLRRTLETSPGWRAAFERRRDAILAERRLPVDGRALQVVTTAGLEALARPPESDVLLGLRARLALSGAGGVGALIAAKVTGQIAAKGGIKLAANAMSKVAASKAIGWAGGAAAGATAGSVAPGLGTVAGATLGAVVGLTLGVSVDALLLTLEEYHSRAAFRRQLLTAIDAQEREFLGLLGTAP